MGLSPALRDRIDALATCRGHWLLIREGEPVELFAPVALSPDDPWQSVLRKDGKTSTWAVPELMGYSIMPTWRPSGIVELPDVHRSSNGRPERRHLDCRLWVEW